MLDTYKYMSETQKLRYSVHYKFTGNHDVIETWLRENCIGEFNIIVEKKPIRANSDGRLMIYFNQEIDRDGFRDKVLKGF